MTTAIAENNNTTKKKKRKQNVIKIVDETPKKYTNNYSPQNITEQKDKFLKHGILPSFSIRASPSQVDVLARKLSGRVSHEYLNFATNILKAVKERHNSGDEFIKYSYGDVIDTRTASALLTQYLNDNGLDGKISIVWTKDLDCSARMMWHGPSTKYNKPEARKHTLIIRNSLDNAYLRQNGIICLANHEIGTHYIRTVNDGLQPWYADRKLFGLRPTRSYHMSKTEEGLASLNTVLQAKGKYLFGPALLYYTACMAESMTFEELFHHLEQFVSNPEKRWHHVMRVKRYLSDPNCIGGLGRDQCYFEGAIEILQNVDNLDFPLIFSGKLCYDEISRIKRLARLDCMKCPSFLEDVEKYKRQLKWIGYINGVLLKPQPTRRNKGKKIFPKSNIVTSSGLESTPKTSQSKVIGDVITVPSNMTLVEQPSMIKHEKDENDANMQHHQEQVVVERPKDEGEMKRIQMDGKCILEKLATKLSFHDDLLRKVDSRLNSASLSIKQSEKLVLNGLKAHNGAFVSRDGDDFLDDGDELLRESCYSPVCYDTCRTLSRRRDENYLTSSFSSIIIPQRKDHGEYYVQPRPPTQQRHSLSLDNDQSLEDKLITCSLRDGMQRRSLRGVQRRMNDSVVLLKRNKSSLGGNDFVKRYEYT